MRTILRVARRVIAVFTVRRDEAALDEELKSLLDLHTDAHLRRGLPLADARAAARREIGNLLSIRERVGDQRRLPVVDTMLQDVRVAARSLRREWRASSVIVVTLALGIGANTALFSVIDAVLFEPLPYRDPDRLVWISEGEFPTVSGPDLDAWKAAARSIESLTAITSADVTLSGDDAQRVRALAVNDTLGRLLGIAPVRGRDFTQNDFLTAPRGGIELAQPGGMAMISSGLFERRFGLDDSVIGRPLLIGRASYTVVGVLPPDFELPVGWLGRRGVGPLVSPEVIVTMAVARDAMFAGAIIGRLAPAATIASAKAELVTIRTAANQSRDERQRTTTLDLQVTPLLERLVGNTRRPLTFLWAASAFVLFVACLNVATLLLARGAARRREFAVRTALGAGRLRLIRQSLTESAVLVGSGGLAGAVVAYALVELLTGGTDSGLPRVAAATVNTRVALVTLMVCALTTLIAGLLPAWLDSRVALNVSLSDTGRTTSSRLRRQVQNAMVVAEVALALVLLTGAGLMTRSLLVVRSQFGTLSPHNVLSLRIESYDPQGAQPAERARFADDLMARVDRLPGVTAAALWSTPFIFGIAVDGMPQSSEPAAGLWVRVTPNFAAASGVPLLAGRWIGTQDGDRPNVVVSRTFVNKLPPALRDYGTLIGRGLGGPGPQARWTIVGVAADFRTGSVNGTPLDDDAASFAQVFFLDSTNPATSGDLLIRTSGDPMLLGPTLRSVLARTPHVNVLEPQTLEDQILASVSLRRLQTDLIAGSALLTLVLALVGTGSLLFHTVAERQREIGVRVAVGAHPAEILGMVIRHGAFLAGSGIAIGLLCALGLHQIIRSLLYGVQSTDAATYILVSVMVFVVSLVAAYLPARRAARVDPIVVLRSE